MLKSYLSLLMAFIACFPMSASRDELPASVEDALRLLDEMLDNSESYYTVKENRIDSLLKLVPERSGASLMSLYQEVCDEYKSYNTDSVLKYCCLACSEARNCGDRLTEEKLRLMWIGSLPIKGVTVEAVYALDSMRREGISDENRVAYYRAANDLYIMMSLNFSPPASKGKYMALRTLYADSLASATDSLTPIGKFYRAKACALHGRDIEEVVGLLNEVIEEVPMSNHLFALASSMLGSYYREMPERRDEAIYYKTLAAVSDVICGVREETALHAVAQMLYEHGDIERSYRYISHSLNNAVLSGSAIRATQATDGLPIISGAFRERDQRKLDVMTWLLVALVVAMGIIIGSLLFIRREVKTLNALKQKSYEANLLKDTFISQFLNLCSIYMEKLEEFSRIAGRKIAAGQVEDLYALIKSGKMLDEQKSLFCEIFDDAFTRIYPTFVEDVNLLLQEDKRITLPDGVKLNTELRILAFMRLGLDDSAQIARFMGLSLNTIYTYRNKLKSKALNRETFEKCVVKIGVP